MLTDRRPQLTRLLNFLAALPPLLLFIIIHVYSVNAFVLDDWGTTALLAAAHNHTLTLAELWRQHNEHRMLFPNILFVLTYLCYHWNNVTLNYESFSFALLSFGILIVLIRQAITDTLHRAIVTAISSAFLFSSDQWFNWFIGFDLQWFTLLFGTFGCICFLCKSDRNWTSLAVAALLATVGTYSLANGLTLWWIVLGLMLLEWKLWGWPKIGAWTAIGLVVCVVFFDGWQPLWQADPHYWIHHPKIFVEYVFAFLGNSFGDTSPRFSIWLGAAGCLLTAFYVVAVLRLKKTTELNVWPNGAIWFILIFSSIASAIVAGTARCPFGIVQALSSRYVTEGNLFWMGLVGATAWLIDVGRANVASSSAFRFRQALWLPAVVLAGAFLISQIHCYFVIQDQSMLNDFDFVAECNNLSAPQSVIDAIFPDKNNLDTMMMIAKRLNQGPFDSEQDEEAAQAYLTGYRLLAAKQYSQAIPQLQIAASHLPSFAFVHYDLGFCCFRAGRLPESHTQLRLSALLNSRYRHEPYNSTGPAPPEWALP